jgi:DNA polymerase epsilon subunit 1
MFKRLRDLVEQWLDDYLSKGNLYAGSLVENVNRWLTSPKVSKLHDPQLHRLVHKLMKKTFFVLINNLKKLGCRVIFANFHRLFIFTDKHSLDEAESQIDYAIENLKKSSLFSFLSL